MNRTVMWSSSRAQNFAHQEVQRYPENRSAAWVLRLQLAIQRLQRRQLCATPAAVRVRLQPHRTLQRRVVPPVVGIPVQQLSASGPGTVTIMVQAHG